MPSVNPTLANVRGGPDHPLDNAIRNIEFAMQELVTAALEFAGRGGDVSTELAAAQAAMSTDTALMSAITTSYNDRA